MAQESQKLGITLSEYVENLIVNVGNLKTQFKNELSEVETLLRGEKEKVEFYENDFLKDLFTKYKTRKFEFVNSKNQKQSIEIKEIKDIYTIIINSFKLKD